MKSGYETPSGHSTRSAFAVSRRRSRRSRVGDGDGAQQADVALEHQLGGGHPGHERDLRVPLLDRQRRAELEPEAAVPLGDHLLGDRQADPAAPHLALPAEDADLAQEPELLVGRAAVEVLLDADVVELRPAADERAPDRDVDALAGLVDVHRPDDGGPRLVGQQARGALREHGRVEPRVLVRGVERLAALVGLDVHRAAGVDERRHVRDRVADAVAVRRGARSGTPGRGRGSRAGRASRTGSPSRPRPAGGASAPRCSASASTSSGKSSETFSWRRSSVNAASISGLSVVRRNARLGTAPAYVRRRSVVARTGRGGGPDCVARAPRVIVRVVAGANTF